MSRASDRRELLRLAGRLRGDGIGKGSSCFGDMRDGRWGSWIDSLWFSDQGEEFLPYYSGPAAPVAASILESLAYEEPPRSGYVDDVKFKLASMPFPTRNPPSESDYQRGFADGVASLNTERAEARAQIEALTVRLKR